MYERHKILFHCEKSKCFQTIDFWRLTFWWLWKTLQYRSFIVQSGSKRSCINGTCGCVRSWGTKITYELVVASVTQRKDNKEYKKNYILQNFYSKLININEKCYNSQYMRKMCLISRNPYYTSMSHAIANKLQLEWSLLDKFCGFSDSCHEVHDQCNGCLEHP